MATENLGKVVGLSAYEVWLNEGNSGTEQDFLDSLKGKDGTDVDLSGYATTNDITKLETVLQDILDVIQGGELPENQVSDIEQLIVSYFENKTVAEVEQ